jgi:hypothetical protein
MAGSLMSVPQPKVEIGFDLVGANAPFFTLDDATKGLLDNTSFPLSGTIFYDFTDRMVEISVNRGKNRQLDVYDPGLASVTLLNNDRLFDPTYEASPFFGAVVPKRALRISSNEEYTFIGVADDWNFQYSPNGQSLVSLSASDAFSYFAEQTLSAGTPSVELSGTRINNILDLPDVNWPDNKRRVDAGQQLLAAEPIADNTNVLSYFQQIAVSEPGSFFISRDGDVVFQDRNNVGRFKDVALTDEGDGIPYVGMRIQYGSELLYNEIVVSSPAGTAIVSNLDSQAEYGILNLTRSGLLVNDLPSLQAIATINEARFSQPEYRFESVDILMDELTRQQQDSLLALEIGDYITITFTPNGIPPAIVRTAEVIRIDHSVSLDSHVMSLGFSQTSATPWTLSDPVFGKLSSGNILYF